MLNNLDKRPTLCDDYPIDTLPFQQHNTETEKMKRIKYTNDPNATARDILEERCNFLDSTLDLIEHMDVNGNTQGWDMADLIAYANKVDEKSREQLAADRRFAAAKRLIRILTGTLLHALKNDDLDTAEYMADAIRRYTYILSSI
jgi:hypothetical protein